ncbi:unnamed protein product [Caenorhabditis bovis]|uniref:Cullin-1 n=1 Tax=Caenorhabditis bovis TaxID=2654633 RepID=A0A8S1EVC0_9PELO|nr:unnamed protein product [Caenorhabditis bovis]
MAPALRNLGYHFDHKGILRNTVKEQFKFTTQNEYEKLGEAITEEIYRQLEENLKLVKIDVKPKESKETNVGFVFASPDYHDMETLLVLIHGSGVVRAGQWARRLIINDNLEKGTQFPYIKAALDRKWGVLVLNTNHNSGEYGKLKYSENSVQHTINAFQYLINSDKIKNIFVVAHSRGGSDLQALMDSHHRDERIKIICLTDSFWSQNRNYNTTVVHFVANANHLKSDPSRKYYELYAETNTHELSSHCAKKGVFYIFDHEMASPGTSTAVDTTQTWNRLAAGLNLIYNREHMSNNYYMELYTSVYNYCTSITLAGDPKVTVKTIVSRSQGTAEFVGQEMYTRVKSYVQSRVEIIRKQGDDLDGENLLQFYTKEWENFRFSSRVMNGIFQYLNRQWIKRELDEGHDNIFMVYTLALRIWKEHLFDIMRDRVIDAVLEMIKKERMGEIINKSFISGVVACLVELGLDEYDTLESTSRRASERDNLKVYRECFELKFLKATREFYIQEASEFLMHGRSVVDYMLIVEKRLEEEDVRCQMYLNSSTKKSLATCCEEVLIATQLEFFQSAFCGLLANNKDDDLARMFKLCDRVSNGLDNLRVALERHIVKEGHEALERVTNEALSDAKLYVNTLLDVHQRYFKLVKTAFGGDPGFMQALDKAATNFINANAVTKRAPPSQTNSKSAELLARYCDQLLRKTAKMPDERELDEMLDKIMIAFKYIDDKDVFSKFYTKMFSKRLINEISASDEAEASFISKLKSMCGYEYTSRLSKMVNDTQVSKDLCGEFKDKLSADDRNKIGLELNVLVLSSGSWPTFPVANINLPSRLGLCVEKFTQFYDQKFNGRKLTWIYSQSRGELVANCFPKKYVYTTTTAQMATILLFNEQDKFTIEQIMNATGMDLKSATAVVASLIKNELLKGSDEELNSQSTITINMGYANKKVRVDLSKITVRQETNRETESVHKNVEEDRKSVISAAIVRVMKTRKRCPHQQLISEVITMLSSRFKPKVDMIKRCIETLIEKEYMKRTEETNKAYEYIS